MSQSEIIGAVLIAGFLLWLAMNKRLGVYWSLLTGGGAQAAPPAPAAPGGGIGGQATVPKQSTAPPTASTVPVNPFPFSFKNTPLCWLGGAWCN